MIRLPADWRLLELQSGRSPTGRAWRGLRCKVTRRLPTAAEVVAHKNYNAMRRLGASHAEAMHDAYGVRNARAEEFAQALIAEGLLIVST